MAQATADSPRTSVRHPLAPLTADTAGQATRPALVAAGRQPVGYTAFTPRTAGLSDRNPALDLAPPGGHCPA